MGSEIDPEIVETFIVEADELIALLDQAVASLKKDPGDAEAVKSIHRAMHTLKGTGSLLGFQVMASVAGPAESIANRVMKEELAVSDDVTAALEDAYQFVKTLVEDIKAGKTSEADLVGIITTMARFLA